MEHVGRCDGWKWVDEMGWIHTMPSCSLNSCFADFCSFLDMESNVTALWYIMHLTWCCLSWCIPRFALLCLVCFPWWRKCLPGGPTGLGGTGGSVFTFEHYALDRMPPVVAAQAWLAARRHYRWSTDWQDFRLADVFPVNWLQNKLLKR